MPKVIAPLAIAGRVMHDPHGLSVPAGPQRHGPRAVRAHQERGHRGRFLKRGKAVAQMRRAGHAGVFVRGRALRAG